MNGKNTLINIIDEVESLINKGVTASSPEFAAWQLKTKRYLASCFGEESLDYKEFSKIKFTLTIFTPGTSNSEFVKACKHGLEKAREMLKIYLDDNEDGSIENELEEGIIFEKVFIVHGHDDALRQKLARVLEKQGIEPIILSEQTNQGKTIIEKFEDYSNVPAAICLYTKDDYMNEKEKVYRARQNVVFETGYFMGKIGRKNVIILSDSEIEMPSDLSGVIFANNSNWELDVLKELNEIGYNIDLNKILK